MFIPCRRPSSTTRATPSPHPPAAEARSPTSATAAPASPRSRARPRRTRHALPVLREQEEIFRAVMREGLAAGSRSRAACCRSREPLSSVLGASARRASSSTARTPSSTRSTAPHGEIIFAPLLEELHEQLISENVAMIARRDSATASARAPSRRVIPTRAFRAFIGGDSCRTNALLSLSGDSCRSTRTS